MAAPDYPASLGGTHLVDSGTVLVPHGYYRSKLFIAPFSTNALVAASGPLLSLLERLCLTPSLPSVEDIRDSIEHELLAFHSKMNASQYPQQLIGIAQYLMSATIDEILGKSYLRVHQEPAVFNAFTPLTPDHAKPEERFFEILSYIQERPNQYLDLIELVYFFLILGFEGHYHLQPNGRQALDNHIEDLYQIIQRHRFNKPHRLFNENPLPKIIKKNYKEAILAITVAVTVVTVVFFTSHFLLENKAKNILLGHSQLALLDN